MASPKQAGADWSALPSAVLDLISQRITNNTDYVRFRAICKWWRFSTAARPRHLPRQPPWLALPIPEGSEVWRFYSVSDGRIHGVDMPEARGNHCCGSSLGWLVFLDRSINFFLLNPLTRQRIPLPPLNTLQLSERLRVSEPDGRYVLQIDPYPDFFVNFNYIRQYFVTSFVLSSDPTSADCVAMASLGRDTETFAFCRPGRDDSWATTLAIPPASSFGRSTIFHKGKFYAWDSRQVLCVVDVDGHPASLKKFPCTGEHLLDSMEEVPVEMAAVQGRRRRGPLTDRVYLVESCGDLLMVLKTRDDIFIEPPGGEQHRLTLDFEVYKLDGSGESLRWVELESLGDRALFLGTTACSLAVDPVSAGGGCRANCIYFREDWRNWRSAPPALCGREEVDFVIYHYGDGHVDRVPLPCSPVPPDCVWQPSVWIAPSLRASTTWE